MTDSQDQPERGNEDIIEDWELPQSDLPSLFVRRSQREDVFTNYHGDHTNPLNKGDDIPLSESISLFITGLPAKCTVKELLKAIRGYGKVFFVHMNPPETGWKTSAAKLMFWEHEQARSLLQATNNTRFLVKGLQIRATWNRIRVREPEPTEASRVIHVDGPSQVVSMEYLEPLFKTQFQYELDEAIPETGMNGVVRLEIRFGSYRAQAAAAWKLLHALRNGNPPAEVLPLLNDNQRWWLRHIVVRWGRDPCLGDIGPQTSSIRGRRR